MSGDWSRMSRAPDGYCQPKADIYTRADDSLRRLVFSALSYSLTSQ